MQKHNNKQEVIDALNSFFSDKELPVEKTREGLKAIKKHANDLLNRLYADHPDPEYGEDDGTGAKHEDTGDNDEKSAA